MPLIVTGLNHQTASVSLRERLAVRDSEVPAVTQRLRELEGVEEVVLLSTCNRVEVYAAGREPGVVVSFLERHFQLGPDAAKLYQHRELDTLRHLFRVVSGLDSMVLGETEIFGQVKTAYADAQQTGTTGRTLNKLFQHAFRVGKRIRSATQIQHGATSVGAAAVELAEKIFGELRDSTVMVLGAGEISRRTAQSLQSRGAQSLIVANRTYDRAVELAAEMGGRAVHYDVWPEEILKVDIVISSTSAPHAIITPAQLRPVLSRRHGRELFLIDIAVPRDIDPACNELEGVYLFNLDDLETMAAKARSRREEEVVRCEAMIETEANRLGGTLALPT
ncbi:MAG: glutamyl-tRNA reductase [Verrucomicrobiales bacterium]